MTLRVGTPEAGDLEEVVAVLRGWQRDDVPLQLHPGDLGWFWRHGAEATAAALRTWRRDGRIVALGLLDGPALLRMTTAPEALHDDALARRLAADLGDPDAGVLPAGEVSVEAPGGAAVAAALERAGWEVGEAWTPLRRDLAAPVEGTRAGGAAGAPVPAGAGARSIAVAGPGDAEASAAVHRSAFGSPRLTAQRWHAMAAGLPFRDARSLLARDGDGTAVAEVTVWSAGPGRPGLLEPMGVHADHRRRGHGRAVCLAAAAALRDLGACAATVCTPSANAAAIATYEAAGFARGPQRRDRTRRAAAPA